MSFEVPRIIPPGIGDRVRGAGDELIIGPASGEMPFGMGDHPRVEDRTYLYQPDQNSYRLGLGYLGDQFGTQTGNAGINTAAQYGTQAAAAQGRWNPYAMANYSGIAPDYGNYGIAWNQGQNQTERAQQQIAAGNANVDAARQQVTTGQAGLGVQHQNLEYLRDVQLGRQGPSLAELQMQQGTEDAIRAQRSAALGTPGWNPAAQAQAARLGEDMQLRNIQATGQQRAAEQATARGMYLQGLGQYGQTSAGLGQQIAGVGGEIQGLAGLEQGLGSMAQGQQASALQAQQLGMGRAEFNAAQTLEAMRLNDALSLGYGDLGRQWYETGLRPLEFEAQQGADYQRLMAEQNMARSSQLNAAAMAEAGYGVQQQGAMMGAAGSLGAGLIGALASDRTMKQDVDKRGGEQANREFQEAMARAYSAGAVGQPPPYQPAQMPAQTGQPATTESTPGQAAAAAALQETDPYAFRYTPEATARYGARTAPQTQRYGIMAQDLAKTPAGSTAVMRGPDGKLAIDPGQLAVLDAMATGDHERRLREMEQRWRVGQAQPTVQVGQAQPTVRVGQAQMISPQAFSAARYGRGY